MPQPIKIVESSKHGFGDNESYIVTRGRTSYLRIVGKHPFYDLMTATASEDDKSYFVCSDKVKLISAALQFGADVSTSPSHKEDRSGRRFIKIGEFDFSSGEAEENRKKVDDELEKFFRIYDACDPASREVVNDMQDVYSALASAGYGGDVYLTDGVWLSADGQLHDRGR